MDQLLCMVFAQLTGRSSLRETVSCLRALGSRRYHCGIRDAPAQSTLAKANERRDFRIFMDTALSMIASARMELPVDADLRRLNSSRLRDRLDDHRLVPEAVSLGAVPPPQGGHQGAHDDRPACRNPRVYAGFPRQSGRRLGARPDRVSGRRVLCDGSRLRRLRTFLSDSSRRRILHHPEPNARWIIACASDWRSNRTAPVRRDQLIRLRGPKSRKLYPDTLATDPLRRSRTPATADVPDQPSDAGALSIALLYRKRWKIELLFKWMKQHLHIKAFFGTTPNAVKTQLWIAVMVYVLVHLFEASQRHCVRRPTKSLQILSVMIFEKTPINQVFSEIQSQKHRRLKIVTS